MLVSNPISNFWAEVDNDEYYTDLLMAIEFSDRDRVSLLIAVCDADRIQAQIINKYTEQLKTKFQAYQIAVNNQQLNVVRSIAELVDREPALYSGQRAVISVVGATVLSATTLTNDADKSDRDTFFGYLQWTRESFQNFHLPIVLWVSKKIYDLMMSEAPDFWSWRTGVFFFKADSEIVNNHDATTAPTQIVLPERDLVQSAVTELSVIDLEQLITRTIQRNPEDPLLPNLYNRLGMLHYQQLQTGAYDDYLTEQNLAIDCFQQAINLAEIVSDFDRSILASSLNNLASLYQSMGRYAEAEVMFVQSLAIREEQGANHPATANSLNNIAGLYEVMGRYAEAEPLLLRSLNINREIYGEEHLETATDINNLASLYQSMGRYAEAEPLLLRSLAIRKQQLGANHPATAISLNNLAELYRLMGRYAEAEPLFIESLAIKEKQLGANHPSTANSLNNLASLYEFMERYTEAEPLLIRSLAIRAQQLGANHQDTANSLNNLAILYQSMGRYAEAEPLCLQSIEIVEKILGINHPHTKTCRDNLQIIRQH